MSNRTPTRYDIKTAEMRHLRKEAGQYIQKHRQAAGLSQKDMAKLLGLEYYTFISQVETGLKRLPPEEIEAWAHALKVRDLQSFARYLFRRYDPVMAALVFRNEGDRPTSKE